MNTDAARLASEFSRILRSWLTAAEMRQVIETNRTEDSPNVCHSHDFCDANEAMLEAATNLGLATVVGATDGTPEFDAACRLWNEAWDLAKTNEFKSEGA